MSSVPVATRSGRWFPVCGSADVVPRHIVESELLEQELAVWRGTDGTLNVWANRCPHRGMRLSAGVNLGSELRCAYHGYRFAGRTGRCTAVPAQPDRTAPQSLCVSSFPALERYGLVWTRLAPGAAEPEPWPAATRPLLALYSVPVDASVAEVSRHLLDYRFRPAGSTSPPDAAAATCATRALDDFTLESMATVNDLSTIIRFFLQPVAPTSTVIHSRLVGPLAESLQLPTQRYHADCLGELRTAMEKRPRSLPSTASVPR